jgi:hypothetical protein
MLHAGKNDVHEWNTMKYNLVVNIANVFNGTYSSYGCETAGADPADRAV